MNKNRLTQLTNFNYYNYKKVSIIILNNIASNPYETYLCNVSNCYIIRK